MESNTTTPNPPVQLVSSIEPKRFNQLMVVMGVIMVLLLLATGYLAYQNMQLQNQIAGLKASQANITYSPTPVATADPMAGWQDVQSSKMGFKIPSGFDWFECNGGDGVFIDTIEELDTFLVVDHKRECNFDYVSLIYVSMSKSSYSIPTNPPVIPTSDPDSPVGEASNLYTLVSETKNIMIDGKSATYQKEDQHGGQGEGMYYKAYVVDGTSTYIFTLKDITQKTIFDQFLTTFQFTN